MPGIQQAAPASTWPQWGTVKAGAIADLTTGSMGGRVFEATNRAEQVLAETVNFPTPLIWFTSQQQADAYAKQHYPQGYAAWQAAQQGPIVKQVLPAAQTALNTGTSSASALASIGDFLSRLTQANTWLRVAEVALGIVLLAVGIARMTNTVPVATKIAKAAGAVALA